jgi:hypothetical protein
MFFGILRTYRSVAFARPFGWDDHPYNMFL